MKSILEKLNLIKPIQANLTTDLIISNESIVYNCHWYEISSLIPDGYFDYVIDDVPYGINVGSMPFLTEFSTTIKQKNGTKLNPHKSKNHQKNKKWDLSVPSQIYFDEMCRISKNQIIFGVDYVDWTGIGKGRIKWNKGVAAGMNFSKYEMAYCSNIDYTHEIDLLWSGMMQAESLQNPMRQQGNKRLNETRIHICQKPVLLYKKIALDFDLKDKKIFCGHNGSGSDRIAFSKYCKQFIATEIDQEHFKDQETRWNNFNVNLRFPF